MRYTKKAYLTLAPEVDMEGGGPAPTGVDMNRLLKTMAMRQEEDKTPYTNQLMRLQDNLQKTMTDPQLNVNEKLKLVNNQLTTYREMLRKSQDLRSGVAGAPAAATAAPDKSATPSSSSLPVPTPQRPRPTPKPRRLQPTTEDVVPLTPQTLSAEERALQTRLLRAKQALVQELRTPEFEEARTRTKQDLVGALRQDRRPSRSRTKRTPPDLGLGPSPVANRTRRRHRSSTPARAQRGRGVPLAIDGIPPYLLKTLPSWTKVRFRRKT